LKELQSLKVTSILLGGRTQIGKFSIAGKGCVSLVVRAEVENGRTCALKIRRADANRGTMDNEVQLHRIANSAGIGPKLIDHSTNFIVMEFAEGLSIIDWVKNQLDPLVAKNVIINILEQCYLLDKAHIDHGELSCIDHHVIVSESNNLNIIDFESSSIQRKPCNVTAAAQSLFLSGMISKRIRETQGLESRERIIQSLKDYKWDQTKEKFDAIINTILSR
jgi:putative serine/threonine protein kinase